VTRRLIALLVLVALLLTGAAGCRSKGAQSDGTGASDGASVPLASSDATTSVDASAGAETPGGTTADVAADTAAIQKELAAIQKELDSMSLPGDSDFDAIAGELP